MKYVSFHWLSPALNAISARFKIDAHYFTKNTIIVMASQIIGIARGFVTGYLVARLFSKEMYGEYQFIASIMGMFALLGLPGFSAAVGRAWSRKEGFSMKHIMMIQLSVALIGSVLLLACIPFLSWYHHENLWPLFVAAAVLFPLPPIATMRFGAYAIGQSRFDLTLTANLIWSALMILATLAVVFLHQSSLLILIVNTSIPSLVYLAMSKNISPPPDPDGKNTKEITRYGWLLTFASLPNDLSSYLDKLLISHFFGLEQLAAFSVAILIPENIKMVFKQLLPVSFARQAVMHDHNDARAKLRKVVLFGTIIFAFGIALFWSVSWWIVPFLFPKYNSSSIVLLANASALILIYMPATLFYQYMEAQRMVRELQWTQWISAAVFSVSLVALVPQYGAMGAIISRGIFRGSSVTIAWWFVARDKSVPPA